MNLSYRNDKNAKFIEAKFNKPLDKPDWYKITASEDSDEADVLIYDYIGWPYNEASEFVRMLAGMNQKKITIKINSPGGDVWDANAIYNAIKSHKSKPVTRIESLAASAASYIAMAGHEKQMYKNGMIMIHEPMTGMWGNQYEFREVADILSQISDTMIDMYADNTNAGKRDLKEMLKTETWMNAKKAKEHGFIDTILEAGKPVKAQYDLSMYANVPTELMVTADKPEPNIRDIEKALRDVGLSQNKAKALLARGWKAESETEPETKPIETIQWDAELVEKIKNNINTIRI
jgi:ATP-dependent Clp endopeptidase proteolytic subunit ClpP